MSTITDVSLVTADVFMQMPQPADGSRLELVRGVIVTMSPPQGEHGLCCAEITYQLKAFVRAGRLGWVTSNDAGILVEQDPDTVRGPDVAFWSRGRLSASPRGYSTVPPDLAVEVVSPSDTRTALDRKLREYVRSGVSVVWYVNPELAIVTVYRGSVDGQTLDETDTLTGDGPLAGFSCRVGELMGTET